MTLPTFQAIGTAVEGTGAVSPAWPAHAVNDVGLLVVESAGGEAATLSLSPGWAAVADSPQSALTGTSGTRLTVFWSRATSTSMPSPTVADPGNHVAAVIVTFRGVDPTGNPWNDTEGGFKDVASTSDTLPGVTTTLDDCLIVLLATRNGGTVGGVWNGTYTNGALGSITERLNGAYASGNGGGILVVTGTKATAGATGTTAATLGASQTCTYLTIALAPVQPSGVSTISAAVLVTSTAAKVGVGASTVSAATAVTSTGRKVAVGASTISAAVNVTGTGGPRQSGASVISAAVQVTGVGKKVPRPVEYEEERNPPGVVWRLGKIGGGDSPAGFLMHVVEWGFEAAWEPEPLGGTFVYPAAVPGPDGVPVSTASYLYPGAEVVCILGGQERRNTRFTIHDPVDEVLRDEDGNTVTHNISWTLLNMFQRLGSSTLHPADGATVLRPKEWTGVLAGVPARFVMHQGHVDGTLEELSFDFDDDADSSGAGYNKSVDLTVDRLGPTGIDIFRTLWDLHTLDMWFEARKLRVFNPDSASQNYAGAGTKILYSGRDLLDAPRTILSRERATRVWVRGDEDRFGMAELPEDELTAHDEHLGYTEITKDAAGVKDPDELNRIAAMYLEIYKQPRRQLTFGINLGWGKDPLIHVQLGDWALKRDGSEGDGKPEKVRVLRCFYKGDRDGNISAGITVSDWFGENETRLKRRIDGIVGGLPGFAKPSRNAVPPAAPTNVVATFSVITPAAGSGGKNWIKADLAWDWSGLDADGAPCGDFDKFLIRWKYGSRGWTVLDGTGETEDEIPRLDPGKAVTIQVGARDEAGNISWSDDAIAA